MKLSEQRKAVEMRHKGYSITDIAVRLSVSKGSVSRWVRDVKLTTQTLQKIKKRSHSKAAVESRRASRLRNTHKQRAQQIAVAQNEIPYIDKQALKFIGTSLYWGEGSKKKPGVVEFTNSDMNMIQVMMCFFTQVCNVPKSKFRGHVYLHSHLPTTKAELYWSKVSGIPIVQFHKTSVQHNKNRIQKDTLPYGTFAIVICDTKLRLKIEGWMQGVSNTIIDTYA